MSSQAFISNATATTLAAVGDGYSVPRMPTAQRLAITFTTSDQGMMVYDTTLNNLFIWNGSAWESVPASGDAGANGAVQYNDNGVVSGASNFFWNKVNQKVGIGTSTPNVELDVVGSQTITGDLTVDTSTLKVDSTNNRVGIGTATPSGAELDVAGAMRSNSWLGRSNVSAPSGDCSIFRSADNTLGFGIASATAMTLNSTGLGIGVTPAAGDGSGVFKAAGTGSGITNTRVGLDVREITSGNAAGIWLGAMNNENTGVIGSRTASGNIAFQTFNGASWGERMRIDYLGNLLVGTTSAATNSGNGFKVLQPTSGHFDPIVVTAQNSSIYSCWDIYSTGGTAGYRFYVTSTGTINAVNTTISAISDQRLKENVQDIDVGLGAILALKPRKFDWKDGKGKNIKGDRGFIAQEFEQVFPQLVDEWKDAAPEGEAPYKSVRQDLIPVLVKAIQELTARVEALEA